MVSPEGLGLGYGTGRSRGLFVFIITFQNDLIIYLCANGTLAKFFLKETEFRAHPRPVELESQGQVPGVGQTCWVTVAHTSI